MIVKCSSCKISFDKIPSQVKRTNNNFCSRSCADKFNNKKFPKRKAIERFCKKCKISLGSRHRNTVCVPCNTNHVDWSKITIQQITDRASYQIHARIRGNARSVYSKSNKPKFCVKCKYSLHYDVCHIKGISSFDKSTPISVVNSIANLVALCKNHHWELDNGHLKL